MSKCPLAQRTSRPFGIREHRRYLRRPCPAGRAARFEVDMHSSWRLRRASTAIRSILTRRPRFGAGNSSPPKRWGKANHQRYTRAQCHRVADAPDWRLRLVARSPSSR